MIGDPIPPPGAPVTTPPEIHGVEPEQAFLATLEDPFARVSWEDVLTSADEFVTDFPWCAEVVERHVGGVAGPVSVLLYRIVPTGDADEWLWVAVGDAPPAVIVADGAPTPAHAVAAYCRQMSRWVEGVRAGAPLDETWPVLTPDGRTLLEPTPETADLVDERLALIRAAPDPA